MPSLPPPVAIEALPGGTAAFERAFSDSMVGATLRQLRLQEALDHLGEMGAMRWDPVRRELEMRGHVFQAEMVGSCRGDTWLWSWGNQLLDLPDSATTVSRAMRDEHGDIAAAAVPFLKVGPMAPHQFGSLVTGNGLASAYYVCASADSEAVYAIVDPIAAEWPPLYELHRAFTSALPPNVVTDLVASVSQAARLMGANVELVNDELCIKLGTDVITCTLNASGQVVSTKATTTL